MPRRLARLWLHIRAIRLHARRLGRQWTGFARRLKLQLAPATRTADHRPSIGRTIRRVVLIVRWQTGRLHHRAIGVVSLLKRQTVWSVAAVTGTVVLVLMLVLQLPSMFAARPVQHNVEHGEIIASLSADDPDAGREPTQDDPFAEVPDAVTPTPRPGTGTSDIPSREKPEPLLDVKLLRLSPYDPNGTQNPEAEFRVSATTTGPADQLRRHLESPGVMSELARGSGLPFSKQKIDDDWRRYDSKRRKHLSQPLLIRSNPTGKSDNRQSAVGKETFDSSRQSSAAVVTRVTAPKLKLLVTVPKRLLVGERCPIRVRMTNRGDAPAKGVLVRIQLPPALAYPKGASLDYLVGTIPAGESRDARLTPRAISAGTVSFTVELERNGRVIGRSVKSVPVAARKESRTARPRVHRRADMDLVIPCPCFPPR